MGGLSTTITIREEIRQAELFVDGGSARCLVHMGKVGRHGGFVCELENGSIVEGDERSMRFIDSEDEFSAYYWGDER